MNGRKRRFGMVFWGILLSAFLVRLVGLSTVPGGINQDEAMCAVDAWALSKYGTDRYGMHLPVHFTAWKYGQMSVFLAYLMIPFIKIFGFTTFAVRLPMVLVSTMGVALMYLVAEKFSSQRAALVIMALTAVNPWHFMQSRWALDCNVFPHVFLLAFYLLLLGLERRKYLYLSMVFFGLTFYCYGVAVYTVPVFLAGYALWCLLKKQLPLRAVLLSIIIFMVVALPEIITMAINMFGWSTIETPFFTMAYFPESIRSNDILLLNFSREQLYLNAKALLTQVFLQKPDQLYNALPQFGPLYRVSLLPIVIGIGHFVKKFLTEKDMKNRAMGAAVLGMFAAACWAGLVTRQVNINRINIIFYPLILFCGYGICVIIGVWQKHRRIVGGALLAVYSVSAALFFGSYFTSFAEEIQVYFNVDFLEIAKEADSLEEYDSLYITGNMGWQKNVKMAEILTQYVCKIDAQYYQEKSNETGGRSLLPYTERYHFVEMKYHRFQDAQGLYILHKSELPHLKKPYRTILENSSFAAVELL